MGDRERALLRQIRGWANRAQPRSDVRVGIGDDAAVLSARAGEEIVVTTDLCLEDVHFRRDWHPPEAVGHKCLARGLSDIASMGARPLAAFLSLALPRALTRGRRSWLERFYNGLLASAERFGVRLAGGDLAQSPDAMGKAVADIVLLGAVAKGRALLRCGARPGDRLFVTGRLGGAAAELRSLERNPQRICRGLRSAGVIAEGNPDPPHPHFFPAPRIAVGRLLAGRALATAAIDVSDGLSTDLMHLCEESGVKAEVEAERLPLGSGATLQDALHGGDDYELLFTAAPETRIPSRLAGVAAHPIGRIMRKRRERPAVELITAGRRAPLVPGGWEHF